MNFSTGWGDLQDVSLARWRGRGVRALVLAIFAVFITFSHLISTQGFAQEKLGKPLPIHRAMSCSAHLISAAQHAGTGEAFDQNLKDTLAVFNAFAETTLPSGEAGGVSASSRATLSRVMDSESLTVAQAVALAERIRSFAQRSEPRFGETGFTWKAGFTLRGHEAIQKFLEDQQALVQHLNAEATESTDSTTLDRRVWAVIFYFMGAYYSYVDGLEAGLTEMVIWGIPMGGDLIVSRPTLDRKHETVTDRFQKALNSGAAGEWVYEAYDTRVHAGTVKSLRNPQNDEATSMFVDRGIDFDRRILWNRIMTWANRFFAKRGRKTEYYTPFKVDRLFTRDATTGEPVLSIVIRAGEAALPKPDLRRAVSTPRSGAAVSVGNSL